MDLHKTIPVKNRNLLTMTTMTKGATGGQIFKIWQPNIFFFSQYSILGFSNGRTVFFFTKYGSFSG
jgi:hypothetical protein